MDKHRDDPCPIGHRQKVHNPPGLLRRRDALILASRQALALILGCVPLLVIAGLIEGFISPNESIPRPVKWGVGLVSGVLLYSYLLLVGRECGKTQ